MEGGGEREETPAPRRGRRPQQESAEHRRARLSRQREYNARRRRATDRADDARQGSQPMETEEHRATRLARQREYDRSRRSRAGQDSTSTAEATVVRETPAQRDQRLSRQREYDQQRRRDQAANDHEDESPVLGPVPASIIQHVESRLIDALGAEGLDEWVCAVCDRLVLRRTCTKVANDQSTCFKNMQRVLQAPSSLPAFLISEYSCSDMHHSLAGMMLARRGLKMVNTGENVELQVCDECHQSLLKTTGAPPKYAIANGFYIGSLPVEFSSVSWMEHVMTQLVTVVAQTRIMRGGRHRAIKSHCMVFDSTPGPPATLLPRRIDRDSSYKVVLAGPFTNEQHDRIRKLHEVRGGMVRRLLEFFKCHNPFYADVAVDAAFIDAIEAEVDVLEDVFITHEENDVSDAINNDQDSITTQCEIPLSDSGPESSVIEQNVLLASTAAAPDGSFIQRVVDLNAHEPAEAPRLQLNHSSRFASSPNIEAMIHPHLFPFGRGHPNEKRQTFVSKRDCLRHYALLSSRRFAQDPTFMLTAFNRLSLENMYTLTSVKFRRFRSLFEGYETLSRDDLATALMNNERRQRGQQGQESSSRTAERFLKSVELGSVSVWGSSAERRQCRQEAFGYQTRFGQPALFVTLTPNTDNSYAMAHYAGILSVSTLFDVLEARTPTPTQMQQAAMHDDSASARLFMRKVDAFIEHVLGIDLKTMESRSAGGLFGKTRANYGMVETQGRGTLHIHFLVWLFGSPRNSEEFEAKVAAHGDEFCDNLSRYMDNIVTTRLPLPVEHAECSACGASGELRPLPISAKARRQRSRHSTTPTEPILVECIACGKCFSSQHVIRCLLLRERPPHWPPPLRRLTEQEAIARSQKESCARSSLSEARNIIREREMTISALVSDESDQFANWMLRINNPSQQLALSAGDDLFRSDPMSRMIEMLPPTVDEGRMTSMHRDFALSSLVVRLNMHLWSHTGSCFKASRATSTAMTCRYGFPRDRAATSSVGGATIIQRRDLFHEYINGYNPSIMKTFKCNHDVQLLLGGKSALNRIYYTCKYVTKAQRQIDSTTAVALASFHRREAREAAQAASSEPPSVFDIRRRRVTSMVHTFTNKQEIAGPLAALYLLRGSCNYSSANCVRLPIADALNQLEDSGEYGCTLVSSSANQGEVYASTSHLDDYLHRPASVSSWSLYEFKMRCYRRVANGNISDRHRFKDPHPLAASHCVAYRSREAVPVISGPRLPLLKEGMSGEHRELFSKLALTLFKPFRALSDLVDVTAVQDGPWWSAYCEWEPHRSSFVRTIMANMNDYHVGRASENEANVSEAPADLSSDSSDTDSVDDGYISDDFANSESDGDEHNFDSIFSMADSADVDDRNELGRITADVFPTPVEFSSPVQRVLANFEQHQLVGDVARVVAERHSTEVVEGPISLLSTGSLKSWVTSAATDDKILREESVADTVMPPSTDERPTTINELIDCNLREGQLEWNEQARRQDQNQATPIYSSVSTISTVFTLNKRQHAAFAIAAVHLLRRWRVTTESSITPISDQEVERRQLLMFLGGEGGTGKSRVVGAIQKLCQSWQRPESVVVTAMTGKAASLIGGRTLASFEMMLKGPGSHTSLREIDCLIIDEVSMMPKTQLLRLDRLLRKAKRVNSVPFGGIHVILIGDFLQLPPVGADPLFIDPATKTKVSLEDFEGFALWRHFQTVVVLEETMRFREDPEWGEGCSKARYGEWSPEFIEIINARLVD